MRETVVLTDTPGAGEQIGVVQALLSVKALVEALAPHAT
jgi:hypothetical protein